MRTRGWVLAGLYGGAVAALAASAFWTPDEGFAWGRVAVANVWLLLVVFRRRRRRRAVPPPSGLPI